jgi:hypothetical protein
MTTIECVGNSNLESIKTKVGLSINAHKAELIVISAYYDCVGNSVSDEEHLSQVKKGGDIINYWNLGVKVIGIWVNNNWNVNAV